MIVRPVWLAAVLAIASTACIIALRLYLDKDPGLRVYYSTPFGEWGALAQLLRGSQNVTCSGPPDPHPAELLALLDAAWCTDGPIPAGLGPGNRSEACQCVAQAWQSLAADACGNQTGVVRNTTPESRAAAGDRVVSCLDRVPRYRITAGGTDLSLVFPTGVCMYCNCATLLVGLGCFLFFSLKLGEPTRVSACGLEAHVVYGQVVLFLVFGVMCSLFLTTHIEGEWLNVAALLVVYLNVAFGLQEEYARLPKSVGEELDMCVFALLPQLLPAYLLLASVAGYGRDLGAYGTAMGLGALLGLALEFCWLSCGGRRDDPPVVESEQKLLKEESEENPYKGVDAGMALTALLCALLLHAPYAGAAGLTYQNPDSPYFSSRAWPLTVFVVVLLLCGVCAMEVVSGSARHTGGLAPVIVCAANLVMTGLTCRDAGL